MVSKGSSRPQPRTQSYPGINYLDGLQGLI
jgi:hypothetical protein